MKTSTPRLLAAALTLCVGLSAAAAAAADGRQQSFDLTKFRYRIGASSVFHDSRARAIARADRAVAGEERPAALAEANPQPATTLRNASSIGDLDGPGNERWYFSAHFDYTEIPPHDDVAFTEYILQTYAFDIYDGDMNFVATVKDKMDYRDEEVRVAMCDLTPVVTRSFFNTDDRLEIIVSLAVNGAPGHNNYRSLVYSLNGEKDSEGYDLPVYAIDKLVGDVVEGAADDGGENFYITFMSDLIDLAEGQDESSFWEYLCAQKARYEVYGKATADAGPRRLLDVAIPLIRHQGDQENVPALISLNHGGQTYFCFGQYEHPFYNNYDDPFTEEMSQREDNNLVIDIYKAAGSSITLSSSTKIPMALDPMNDADGNPTCLFSYYCVGGMRYSGDFLFDCPGAEPEKPWFIVTRSNYQVSTDDTTDSYYTYSHEGERKNTLFEYAVAAIGMDDIAGHEPQQMFVANGAWGYVLKFVDIYSARTVATINYDYAYDSLSDAVTLTTNIGRTPGGDSYKYVCELRYPLVDDQGNSIMRFIWINADGTFDHFDDVNMGQEVAYAQSYISTQALAPHAYATNDAPTYMMLVKRGASETALAEELLIAQAMTAEAPQGATLLNIGADEKGPLSGIVPEFGEKPQLLVYRYDSAARAYSLDVYKLPFDVAPAAIAAVAADAPGSFAVEGTTLSARGMVAIYTAAGTLAAAGSDRLDISRLAPGLYIVVADGTAGKLLVR